MIFLAPNFHNLKILDMSAIDQLITDNDAAVETVSAAIAGRLDAITRELRPYAVYTALLSQAGTDAPIVRILENSLGEEPTWDYTDVGRFGLNITGGIFEQYYTWASVNTDDNQPMKRQFVNWGSASRLVLAQLDGVDYVNGIARLYLEVRVFPAPSR
jgi:hypothetical protein